MINNNALVMDIATKLCISRDVDETEQQWYRRVAYSLVGCHMLAALYDFTDDDIQLTEHNSDNTVSMQHVLKRGNDLVSVLGIPDVDCEKFRKLFINTGYMLHKNNRLAYPQLNTARVDNILFLRGYPPWETSFVSGIGGYIISADASTNTLERMFGIEEQNINSWFSIFENDIRWQKNDSLPQNIEFLNINENAKNGYWQTKPPQKGITLSRTKDSGLIEYTILRLSSIIEKSELPYWRVENGEYYRIAIALRIANGNAPTVAVRLKLHTADLVTDFLLPPAEQNFLELYSWPTINDSRWRRTIAIKLYPTFKCIFEKLGYIVSEVQ